MEPARGNAKKGLEVYARLRNVLGIHSSNALDLKSAFGRVAHLLSRGRRSSGTLQIIIGGKGPRQSWVLNMTEKGCEARKEGVHAPRFEVVVHATAILAMLSGRMAPIEALALGQMRVRGDLEFGMEVYRALAADNGRVDPCN